MANKKMYFYDIKVYGDRNLENIFDGIIEKYGEESVIDRTDDLDPLEIKTIPVKIDNKFYSLEIILKEGSEFFCRLGKEKDSASLTKRKENNLTESLVSKEKQGIEHIESLTHVIIDAKNGFMAYLGGIDVAKPSIVGDIINECIKDENSHVEINQIMELESIRKLIKNNSEIDNISIKLPAPNIYILEALELDEELIKEIMAKRRIDLEININARGRGNSIYKEKRSIERIVNFLEERVGNRSYGNAKVKGKEDGFQSKKEYSFDELSFNENMNINIGEKDRRYQDYEFTWECYNKMTEKYNTKLIERLKDLSNKE